MNKLLIGLLFLVVAFTGCSVDDTNSMTIKPSEFSQETLKVLELFDDELQFFDVDVNETAKSFSLSIWGYKENEWQENGKIYGDIRSLNNQIAINLSQNDCELFLIDNSGHSSSYYPEIQTDFENSMGIGGTKLDRKITIELNKEIPIWVKTGTKDGKMRVSDITEDFRNIECNAGVAVTLIVSDEIIS